MPDILGFHVSSSLFQIFLVLAGAVLYSIFREIIPDWIRHRRKSKEEQNEQIKQWHSECLKESQKLRHLVIRGIKNPNPDYKDLQDEFDRFANSFAKLADDHRSPDSEVPKELGRVAKGCVYIANICEIFSEYDGVMRICQLIILQDSYGNDISIGGAMEMGQRVEEVFDINSGLSDKHVDSDQLEAIMDKYEFPDGPGGDLSIQHPVIVDMLSTVDDSQINRIADDIFRTVLSNLLLEVSGEMRKSILDSSEKDQSEQLSDKVINFW